MLFLAILSSANVVHSSTPDKTYAIRLRPLHDMLTRPRLQWVVTTPYMPPSQVMFDFTSKSGCEPNVNLSALSSIAEKSSRGTRQLSGAADTVGS